MRKAQEAKVVGTGKAPYGFYYADDHYHVDADRMPFVHEIFEMIADGHSIYEVAQHLRRNGTPSPRGADGSWGRTTIRNIILSDTYLGTFWWGKEKSTTTTVSVVEDGVHTYKKKVKREERPKEEWTAIPVPDSGIPPEETIAHARDSHTLKGIENPLSGHYALTEFPESYNLVDIDEMHSLGYGSKETASRRRQEFYRQSGLRVKVGEELGISLGIDRVFVGADESASDSTRSPTGTL